MAELIMGIDPGTIVCGYALVIVEHRHQMRAHSYGSIRLSAKKRLTFRYKELFLTISDILEKERPDTVIVETQYMQKNPQSTIKLAMAKGVTLLAATLKDIPVFEYTPNVAKRSVVGKGNASKQQVQTMVSKIFNLPDILNPKNEDIADAFALAVCHAHAFNPEAIV